MALSILLQKPSERKCRECGKSLPPNTTRQYCDTSCYRKFRYKLKKPVRICEYCKYAITTTGYTYCSPKHRKLHEQILRARKKLAQLLKKRNRYRNGHHKTYKEQWQKQNPDRVKQYYKKYYDTHKEQRLEAQRKYYVENRQEIIRKNRERRAKQSELIKIINV